MSWGQELMNWVDFPFWMVGGVAPGIFGLRIEVTIDVRSVRYYTYVKFLNDRYFFVKIKIHVCRS